MNTKQKKNQKGFTLMELITTIALMGIAAAVLAPSFMSMMTKYKLKSDIQSVQTLQQVLDVYSVDGGSKSLTDLKLEVGKPIPDTVFEELVKVGYLSQKDLVKDNTLALQTEKANLHYVSCKDDAENHVVLNLQVAEGSKLEDILTSLGDQDKDWVNWSNKE